MNDFLSGYNFARQSDVVFSETIPENNSHRTYIVDEFELNDNDIIFCKTDKKLNHFLTHVLLKLEKVYHIF